jgi:hypothetical protein
MRWFLQKSIKRMRLDVPQLQGSVFWEVYILDTRNITENINHDQVSKSIATLFMCIFPILVYLCLF